MVSEAQRIKMRFDVVRSNDETTVELASAKPSNEISFLPPLTPRGLEHVLRF